jgi:NtrC-family two-component system sensor histidine kinase KinB
MALKLKTRIALGGLFLFLLLALTGGVSFYHFNKLINESKGVLKANYETVEFGKNMLGALSTWKTNPIQAKASFETSLKKQEANITETGEAALTRQLRNHFDVFTQHADSLPLLATVQSDISHIIDINLKAIYQKSNAAQEAAEDAKLIITIIITFCLLIGFTFMLNFPGLIAGPVSKLTEAIKAISNKNYSQRIHLNRKDEFGDLADAFNNMAEQLDTYEHSNLAKIMFEKQRAETVINSLKDASIGIDNKGIILFANEQALQLLHVKEADIVGKPQQNINNDLFRFLVEDDNKSPFKVVLNDRENYFVKENISIANLGKMIVVENITSFKEMDVAKTNFIATISHELKTPLASSDFSLKLLEDPRVAPEEQKELIQQLKNDNQRMLRILSELLNMSQVEAGKIQLDIKQVDAYQVVDASLAAVQTTAKEKGIHLEKRMAENLPGIQADADKIGWVLNNFLTNAIKYAPAGSPVVIDVKKIDGGISFSVTDQGTGIDEVYLNRIFERYFQVPGRSDKKGSGIGLAICKEFIEAMGGVIWVASKPGQGSTFGFDLPFV